MENRLGAYSTTLCLDVCIYTEGIVVDLQYSERITFYGVWSTTWGCKLNSIMYARLMERAEYILLRITMDCSMEYIPVFQQ